MATKSLKRRKPGDSLAVRIVLTALIWGMGLLMIVPFIWMLSTSFKGMNDVFTFPIEWIPKNPTLKGYQALFSGKVSFFTYFFNSVKVAVIALTGTLCSCTMAGYAYAKIPFVGRNKIFMVKLMTTMLPGMVTMPDQHPRGAVDRQLLRWHLRRVPDAPGLRDHTGFADRGGPGGWRGPLPVLFQRGAAQRQDLGGDAAVHVFPVDLERL